MLLQPILRASGGINVTRLTVGRTGKNCERKDELMGLTLGFDGFEYIKS